MWNPHVNVAGHATPVIPLASVGLFIGYVAGMFGVGGGFLLTPILNIIFRIPIEIAVGQRLCQKVGTSIASFLKYRYYRRGEPRFDWVMMAGSVLGVDAGTRLLGYLSTLHALALASTHPSGWYSSRSSTRLCSASPPGSRYVKPSAQCAGPSRAATSPSPAPSPRFGSRPTSTSPTSSSTRVSVRVLVYVGFVLGMLSGLMGIGGGVAFMPVLLYGYGLSVRNAAGTGILLMLVTVVTGTIVQALHNFVSLPLAMAILIGSSIGSQLGALTTHRLPNRILRLLFGGLVAITVLLILWDLVGSLT